MDSCAVIDRAYSLEPLAVGAVYDRALFLSDGFHRRGEGCRPVFASQPAVHVHRFRTLASAAVRTGHNRSGRQRLRSNPLPIERVRRSTLDLVDNDLSVSFLNLDMGIDVGIHPVDLLDGTGESDSLVGIKLRGDGMMRHEAD